MAELAIFDSQGKKLAGNMTGFSKKVTQSVKSGVIFYANMSSRREIMAQFFMAKRSSGGRSEQHMAVYEGSLQSLDKFEKEILEMFNERIGDGSQISKNTLYILSARPRNPGVDEHKMADILRRGDKVDVKVGSERRAYQFAKFLILEDHQIGDDNISLGITEGSFRKGFGNPDVKIKIDDSVHGVQIVDETAGRKIKTNNSPDFGSDKPSGPKEWLKGILPF